jgi:hypothetical protein
MKYFPHQFFQKGISMQLVGSQLSLHKIHSLKVSLAQKILRRFHGVSGTLVCGTRVVNTFGGATKFKMNVHIGKYHKRWDFL